MTSHQLPLLQVLLLQDGHSINYYNYYLAAGLVGSNKDVRVLFGPGTTKSKPSARASSYGNNSTIMFLDH